MELINSVKCNLTDKNTHVSLPLEVKYAIHNITGKMVLKHRTLHQHSFTICKLIVVTTTFHTVPFTVTFTVFSVVPTVLLAT